MERLQKLIAESGYCSRRKAEELIKQGKVTLNGKKVTELGMWVFSECTSLQTAVLPKQITTVPEDCFVGCKSLLQ